MQQFEVVVDFGGIVVFDDKGLQAYFGNIAEGDNLYRRFTTTDDGDKVVEQGIVIPIIGVNDSSYRVSVRMAGEPSIVPDELIIVRNASFPLRVTDRLIIADLAVFLEWYPEEGWQRIDIAPGCYAVAVNGFRKVENNVVVDFGFEIVLTPADALPPMSASLQQNMQVLELPG
ncbi:hypothetical protein CR152_30380 [Massilia violaceinigra]|uniref:Uncharacterized protein n=1 Tax=Massilia violaceinigra TaxID=2045208 RepID=A0A2D2DTN3_9BURK|nr:hypothetical protein [Massilia violaceinigra]ATQ78335.1 hypothetical protein CR152_30380 [Massilia violaceinigra]